MPTNQQKSEIGWEKEFRGLAFPIIHSNTFPEKDNEYLEMLIFFISKLLSSERDKLKAKLTKE